MILKVNFSQRNFNGFTFIELLVVIAIIAVLTAILLPVLSGAKEKITQESLNVSLIRNKSLWLF